MDFGEESNAQSICFDPPLPQVSVCNEPAGFDRELWSTKGGGGGGS